MEGIKIIGKRGLKEEDKSLKRAKEYNVEDT